MPKSVPRFLVSQEERHKTIVRNHDDKTEAQSFAVQSISAPLAPRFSPSQVSLMCTYCGKAGHLSELCYQRVGFAGCSGRCRVRSGGRGKGRGTFRPTTNQLNTGSAPPTPYSTSAIGSNAAAHSVVSILRFTAD
ncbi:hypothetical protein LIER_39774 [Lithospermum erythrorhizon]|uniref:CCHC-type domain-containing protein n=1 Tax=Lithospermum erythrorhizon TaxID=34254 RepID=A0AAV3QQQ7_LITER